MTSINLKQAQKWLMKKSLPDFIREFWDAYESATFSDCWLIDWQSECFMYSVKHFLPRYVWEDWVTDEQYARLKLETYGNCPVRDKLFRGQHVHNHDWNMPPRHSKTSIIGVCGPTWLAINTPISVATVSHTSRLSGETNDKRLKLLQSEKFHYYFHNDPGLKLNKQSATNIQLVNGAQMYAVCQISFTGLGADCFPAGTKILTPFGYQNIEKLLDNDKVISYNTKCGEYQISEIQATRRIIDNEFVRITVANGKTIESTADHRYWVVGRGYVKACELTEKDCVLLESIGENALSNMWNTNVGFSSCLSKVHVEDMELRIDSSMRALWKNIPQKNIKLFRAYTEKLQAYILRKEMSLPSKQYTEKEKQILSYLWQTISKSWSYVLLKGMFGNSTTKTKETIYTDILSTMRFTDTDGEAYKILFEGLCEQISFYENVGKWKFKLQRWNRISESIYKSNNLDYAQGQLHVSDLRKIIRYASILTRKFISNQTKFGSSSYRPKYSEQFFKQFDYFMHELPCQVAQKQRISKVERFIDKKLVYDIQVSDNHNFFANGVLVHNCIIADDLISADNAAKDMQVLRNVRAFFRQTLPTRLNTKETGVIWHVQQRLARGDISGMIAEDPDLSKVYSHTELQAIAEKDQVLIYPCSGKVMEIHKGDFLWAKRFGDYTRLKLETGQSKFNIQYQQKVEDSDLNVIHNEDIHYIEPEELDTFANTAECVYASHDCPVKDSESNDFHGFVHGYGRGNELIIDDGWEEHLGYVKEKQLMITQQQICPSLLQIVEDKSNGAALLQDLRLEVKGLIAFNPETNSKKQRLELASVYVQSGAVRFIRNAKTEYLIKKLLDFPFVDHDDIVDAFSQLVLYHFTQRKAGVYTNCFTYNNVVKDEYDKTVNVANDIYGCTINSDLIKILRLNIQEDKFIVMDEWQVRGLESFEQFFLDKFQVLPIMLDCSYENTLYKLIKNPKITLIPFHDDDRDGSIHSLKVGFYKKKVLVKNTCTQTINDISKLRYTPSSIEVGKQIVNTYDEGLSGCLRGVINYYKGNDIIW